MNSKSTPMSKELHIYTDGGCWPNPGPGAWACAIDKEKYIVGFVPETTNNRMEMTAIIYAIKYLAKFENDIYGPYEGVPIIYTDSQYCIKGFHRWMHKWKKKGWTRGDDGHPVKNKDLWIELYKLRNNAVLKFVKGHSGVEMNEFVDQLCASEIEENGLSQ